MNWWLGLLLRLLAAALPTYLLWRFMGPTGLVLGAPLLGLALAKPLYEAVARSLHLGKHAALKPWEGRYFQFHGHGMDILDDEQGRRWLLSADARKVLPQLAGDEVLQRLFPDDKMPGTAAAPFRIRADRLVDLLERARSDESVRFRRWLLREVVEPAQRRHANRR